METPGPRGTEALRSSEPRDTGSPPPKLTWTVRGATRRSPVPQEPRFHGTECMVGKENQSQSGAVPRPPACLAATARPGQHSRAGHSLNLSATGYPSSLSGSQALPCLDRCLDFGERKLGTPRLTLLEIGCHARFSLTRYPFKTVTTSRPRTRALGTRLSSELPAVEGGEEAQVAIRRRGPTRAPTPILAVHLCAARP